MKYKTIEELIDMIERPIKTVIFDIYQSHKDNFKTAPGSEHNHQAWEGGYIDHLVEVMNIARLFYGAMNDKRKLQFTLSDVLIVLFLHDLEKSSPDRIKHYTDRLWKRAKAKDKVRYQMFHEDEYKNVWEYLNDSHKNAIDFVEGEKDNYSNGRRAMRPLAAFCHLCDVTSSRIWFDRPSGDLEPWGWRSSIEEDTQWGV